MDKLAVGDAVAAGGIVLAGFTLLNSTSPGVKVLLRADPDDETLRAELRRAELAAAIVVLAGTAVMSGLMHEAWPLGIGLLAVVVAAGLHEAAQSDSLVVGDYDDARA